MAVREVAFRVFMAAYLCAAMGAGCYLLVAVVAPVFW